MIWIKILTLTLAIILLMIFLASHPIECQRANFDGGFDYRPGNGLAGRGFRFLYQRPSQ